MIAHEWDVPVNSNNTLKMRLRRLPIFCNPWYNNPVTVLINHKGGTYYEDYII